MGLFLQITSGLDVLGERKNERLEIVKNLGSENKQNANHYTTCLLSRWPIGPHLNVLQADLFEKITLNPRL